MTQFKLKLYLSFLLSLLPSCEKFLPQWLFEVWALLPWTEPRQSWVSVQRWIHSAKWWRILQRYLKNWTPKSQSTKWVSRLHLGKPKDPVNEVVLKFTKKPKQKNISELVLFLEQSFSLIHLQSCFNNRPLYAFQPALRELQVVPRPLHQCSQLRRGVGMGSSASISA